MAAPAPAAMIEICTRLDMFIVVSLAKPRMRPCDCWVLVRRADPRSDYLKGHSKVEAATDRMIAIRRAPRKPSGGLRPAADASCCEGPEGAQSRQTTI